MEQSEKKVSKAFKALDQVLRQEMADFKMGEEAIKELTNLGQAWGKTQAFPRREPETAECFTARRIR